MRIEVDAKYMARCISLARNGSAFVSPNPMVGAVLVHNKRIIGEGFHRKYGEPHAEVNALHSVLDRSLLKESTLYVNLEPCSHYGKTPPCAELIIENLIPRVVVGCLDPYPEVAGRGIDRLRAAGVEVVVGVLENESYALNSHFMVSHSLKRPFISLKWAQSQDGFIDTLRPDASTPPSVISSPNMRQLIHKKRSDFDAILVGTRTALLDNPSLTIRHWAGNNPVRVVLDKNLTIPSDFHLMDQSVQTIVFTNQTREDRLHVRYITLDESRPVLDQILKYLSHCRLNSLLVEGGTTLIESFLREELWDEVQLERSPINMAIGVKAPALSGRIKQIQQEKKVNNLSPEKKGYHLVTTYYREKKLQETCFVSKIL